MSKPMILHLIGRLGDILIEYGSTMAPGDAKSTIIALGRCLTVLQERESE